MNVIDPRKKIIVDGIVVENLPGTLFRVEVDINGKKTQILSHLSGKMRMNYIKLNVKDKVKLEISPYDLSKARIIYRY